MVEKRKKKLWVNSLQIFSEYINEALLVWLQEFLFPQ